MDPQIKKALNQDVVVEPALEVSGRGGVSYGTSFIVKSYIAGGVSLIRGRIAETLQNNTMLFLEGTPEALGIKQKDKLTLPDGSNPIIEKIEPYYWEDGSTPLVVVILG